MNVLGIETCAFTNSHELNFQEIQYSDSGWYSSTISVKEITI